MLKNKFNFKLINVTLFVMIIYFIYQAGGFWKTIFSKTFGIIIPLIIAFAIAYALYPYVVKIMKKNVPKWAALLIVLSIFFGLFTIVFVVAVPLLLEQVSSLFSGLITFFKDISMKYDLDFGSLQDTLTSAKDIIISKSGEILSSGAISAIGTGLSYISTGIIVLFLSIYILVDMDKIRKNVKEFYLNKGKKRFNYVLNLDKAMKGYLSGFTKIMGITLVEYTCAFAIIGHPNAILLGCLAAVGNLIPYFGGIFTNIVAMITAFVVSPALFIRALILFIVLSLFDSYVINPFVYGKTTKLPSIAIILSVFIGGSLFGIFGIIISLPVTIILVTTYRYYKQDIANKLEELKN